MTIKGPDHYLDTESQEQTIRPIPRKVAESPVAPIRGHRRSKTSPGKSVGLTPGPTRPRSPTKPSLGSNKFELPARPDLAYREQSVEDYSDLFVDNDNVFDSRVNQAVKKVRSLINHVYLLWFVANDCAVTAKRCATTIPPIRSYQYAAFYATTCWWKSEETSATETLGSSRPSYAENEIVNRDPEVRRG